MLTSNKLIRLNARAVLALWLLLLVASVGVVFWVSTLPPWYLMAFVIQSIVIGVGISTVRNPQVFRPRRLMIVASYLLFLQPNLWSQEFHASAFAYWLSWLWPLALALNVTLLLLWLHQWYKHRYPTRTFGQSVKRGMINGAKLTAVVFWCWFGYVMMTETATDPFDDPIQDSFEPRFEAPQAQSSEEWSSTLQSLAFMFKMYHNEHGRFPYDWRGQAHALYQLSDVVYTHDDWEFEPWDRPLSTAPFDWDHLAKQAVARDVRYVNDERRLEELAEPVVMLVRSDAASNDGDLMFLDSQLAWHVIPKDASPFGPHPAVLLGRPVDHVVAGLFHFQSREVAMLDQTSRESEFEVEFDRFFNSRGEFEPQPQGFQWHPQD